MRGAVLPVAAVGLCLGAYTAGNLLAETQGPVDLAPDKAADEAPILPDPHRLAGTAALQLEALPRAVWRYPAPPQQTDAEGIAGLVGPASPAMIDQPLPAARPASARPVPPGGADPAEAAAIKAAISQNLAAIVKSNGTYRLILADRATTVRRSLVVGDLYEGDWRISRIAADGVMLAKAGARLEVPVAFAPGARPALASGRNLASRPGSGNSPLAQEPAANAPSPRRRVSRRITALNQE